jgi:hypothetical protein
MSLIGLLVFVIVVGVIFYVLSLLPLPEPWKKIATILLCLIVLLYLLSALGIVAAGPIVSFR